MTEPLSPASITMSDPQGIALVLLVALLFTAIRLFPRWLAGQAAVSAVQLKQRLDSGEAIWLLDVRETAEFHSTGHIPGSIQCALSQLKLADQPLKSWHTQAPCALVVMCHSGLRAAFAVRRLKRMGFPQAQVLSGGLQAWEDEAYPLTTDT